MRRYKKSADAVVKDIKRQTRRKFSSEEKIRIVLESLKGEESVSEICRREGIAPALYYTVGARTSSKLVRDDLTVIQYVKRTPARSTDFERRTVT